MRSLTLAVALLLGTTAEAHRPVRHFVRSCCNAHVQVGNVGFGFYNASSYSANYHGFFNPVAVPLPPANVMPKNCPSGHCTIRWTYREN